MLRRIHLSPTDVATHTVTVPVPAPKLYVQLSPVRVSLDVNSAVWLGAFLPHVAGALAPPRRGAVDPDTPPPAPYMDVRMEAIMPKVSRMHYCLRNPWLWMNNKIALTLFFCI